MTLGSIFSQEDVRFGHPLDFFIILDQFNYLWSSELQNNYIIFA